MAVLSGTLAIIFCIHIILWLSDGSWLYFHLMLSNLLNKMHPSTLVDANDGIDHGLVDQNRIRFTSLHLS